MKYKLEERQVWIDEGTKIIKMYFINSDPFTFDELPDGALQDRGMIEIANKETTGEMDDLFKAYQYLMDEECNERIFNIELKNTELKPVN